MAATKKVVHVPDLREDEGYLEEPSPQIIAAVEEGGVRTMLIVPMLKENQVVGTFTVYRQEVRDFTTRQIELVQNFAAQAVIAIENARLLNELRQRTTDLTQRTADLTDALEQQTATSEVLRVISRSTFDLQIVLDTLTKSAAQLCAADKGIIFQRDGEVYRLVANYGFSREAERYWLEHPRPVDHGSVTGRALLEGRAVHVPDVLANSEYRDARVAELAGYRTGLAVPLLRGGTVIGVFALSRDEVNPFTEKQIELVTTFADQAVIAIENVRLFEAEQERTRELTESLQQQTATSEVLRVISTSPSELEPVFGAILANGARLCEASFGILALYENGAFRVAGMHNVPEAYAEYRRLKPVINLGPQSAVARMAVSKGVIHYLDYAAEVPDGPVARLAGARSVVAVPMLKDSELVGVIYIYRQEVRAFTDKQIALLENFAAQAVIAIENTRLLSELRQRTDELGRSVDELRALGEVSQTVNSTLDLETVLSTIVAKAVQLSGTEAGAIYVFDDRQRELHLRATYGMDQELIDTLARQHIGIDETNVAQALARREPVQIADLKEQPPSAVNEIILRAGFRALLVAPLLRGEEMVGTLVVRRRTPGAFPQNTVDLVKTFAAQSAVAIENARLFHNVEASLEDLRTAQDRLVQTEKLASLGQLTAGIAHEIKNPLNFVNNFSAVSVELIDELREALGGVAPRQQAARRDQRDRRYAARQSRQGRAARQARRRDRQEHAVAFASGVGRAPAGRYQRPGR